MCFGGAGGEPWGLFWAFLMVQDGRESGGPAWGGERSGPVLKML